MFSLCVETLCSYRNVMLYLWETKTCLFFFHILHLYCSFPSLLSLQSSLFRSSSCLLGGLSLFGSWQVGPEAQQLSEAPATGATSSSWESTGRLPDTTVNHMEKPFGARSPHPAPWHAHVAGHGSRNRPSQSENVCDICKTACSRAEGCKVSASEMG